MIMHAFKLILARVHSFSHLILLYVINRITLQITFSYHLIIVHPFLKPLRHAKDVDADTGVGEIRIFLIVKRRFDVCIIVHT